MNSGLHDTMRVSEWWIDDDNGNQKCEAGLNAKTVILLILLICATILVVTRPIID